ncbi:hypothetical protein [Actibacterium ureilyticum]|uniref:hypothetical protein n=1 Tax=Actibacterium ureilyticum TaxID=1590614 RepID=UPI000BAAA414|nr:hypothetical protein [Actibacterium ureilyticum]
MNFVAWAGRHASALLLVGFATVPFLPVSAETLRPLLPPLVILVTALGVARQPIDRRRLKSLFNTRQAVFALLWVILAQVVATRFAVSVGQLFGATSDQLIFVAAFFAAPPLSSAPNICLILGYDYAVALRVSVLGTICAPVLMPLALSLSGLDLDVSGIAIALRVFGMLLGGVALGVLIQIGLGPARVARHVDTLNGLAALAMIAFLFPLISGAKAAVVAAPHLALALLCLALTLNLLGNLLVRQAAGFFTSPLRSATLGYVFGNRNLSVFLASVPFDPDLTLFVALMQAPIYATPALFSFIQRSR